MTRGLLVVLAVLSSCTPASPREVADGYLSALHRLDFGGAQGYMTDEGRATLRVLQQVYAGLGPEEQKKFQVGNWAVTGVTVTGDTALVDFSFDQQNRGQLTLQRVSGVWKVAQRTTF